MSLKLLRHHNIILIFIALVLGWAITPNPVHVNTITVATFADPALDASTPLFTVHFGTSGSVTVGLDDSQTCLDLEVPITGAPTYQVPS